LDFDNRVSGSQVAAALPVAPEPHPSASDLSAIIEGGVPEAASDGAKETWRHVLNCGDCFNLVVQSRSQGSNQLVDVPHPGAAAEAVWDVLRARRLGIILAWTGAALQIALRSSPTRKLARRRGVPDSVDTIREVGRPWTLQRQFGAYTV